MTRRGSARVQQIHEEACKRAWITERAPWEIDCAMHICDEVAEVEDDHNVYALWKVRRELRRRLLWLPESGAFQIVDLWMQKRDYVARLPF